MPRYKVRLEDPDSDEFRVTVLTAKDKNEAQAICEKREQAFVEAGYSDEELAEAGNPKGAEAINAQSKPYEVVAVVKRGEKFDRGGQ